MSSEGQVVLITGATGGLGPHVVRAFAGEGARLVLSARERKRLDELAGELGLGPERVLLGAFDAGDASATESLVHAAEGRFGRIDALVNLAGGYRGGKPVHELGDADWEEMLGLNLRSVYLMCRAVVPGMIRAGYGRIVTVASQMALRSVALHAPYAASKAALLRLTESLAAELASDGIRANAVVPSVIDTEANRRAMPDADRSSWVTPEALAAAVVFLASPGAEGVNGIALPVYGGKP